MKQLVEDLLQQWSDSLLNLQIKNPADNSVHGAIYCPACKCIHGRCFEAMYPFLHMAEKTKDDKWIAAAQDLFLWAENNVSQPDGSFVNDKNCDWKGTTVFNTIALADCIIHHKEIIPKDFLNDIITRIKNAADFLYTCEEINENNINYPISNALALYECSMVLHDWKYAQKAEKLAMLAQEVVTKNSLLFGEGVPRFKKSAKGCNAVDIGYNVEETLPSLAVYGLLSNNATALKTAEKGLNAHLCFMLDNGGWNNSFGTRNFKWTYWGSRTSDGCALGYLLFAKNYPQFALAAEKNIQLMQECSINGLLAGGPHYVYANQQPCVHHTFTHAKVLAAILDRKLCCKAHLNTKQLTNQGSSVRFFPEIDTYLINKNQMSATITGYDWEYKSGGHVSGGTLTLLHHSDAGTLLCASTSDYIMYEPHNMQSADNVLHECIALRIENDDNGLYSSIYETSAKINQGEQFFTASGYLKDIKGHTPKLGNLSYEFTYCIEENSAFIKAQFEKGVLICPVISSSIENFTLSHDKKALSIIKENCKVQVISNAEIELPYGEKRVFNFAPGLQALKLSIKPVKGIVNITIKVITC